MCAVAAAADSPAECYGSDNVLNYCLTHVDTEGNVQAIALLVLCLTVRGINASSSATFITPLYH